MSLDHVFEALASTVRRKILAYLSGTDLTAGEIAERFNISKPSISKHLSILENAGQIASERRGQFIHYRLVRDNLANTLNGYVPGSLSSVPPSKTRECAHRQEQELAA